MKPIISRAEVALDYPDKTYMGIFEHESRYAVDATAEAFIIKFEHHGAERKTVDIHVAHMLFAHILEDLAELMQRQPPMDEMHADAILESLAKLKGALSHAHAKKAKRRA
ncbi:MAG: hypothetical protein FJX35_14540 [Alphaproteobacteria bacterium]|nr:hypothetical protein [Alphaproteobacteria bacterium]